ncbi:competence type IV pilus minor pilin ComGD [Streptococcus intermedius]|uniref:competence type IV pilus minor pilin ComGD n=1 Tax=Streptococcus intermedius TaxID=1338 RepID=UPI002001C4F3
MRNIQKKLVLLQIKGFTILESLLTLFVASFLLLAVSGAVRSSFEQVEEQIFFLEFEHFYRESQKLSNATQRQLDMNFSRERISNGYNSLSIPRSVHAPDDLTLRFDKAGGNSSLGKIVFQTKRQTIMYQLYLGNGKFKKTIC